MVLRLAFFPFHQFAQDHVATPDSGIYLELGRNLAERGMFGRTAATAAASVENPVTFEVFRTPGYPLVIALLGSLTRDVVPALICLGVLLDVATVVLVYLIARTLMEPVWSFIAASLVAVDVGHVVYANMIMSDVLFASLVTVATWLLLSTQTLNWRNTIGSALAFTAAAAVRPVGTLMFAPAAMLLVARRLGPRRVAAFVLVSSIFPGVWILRNGIGVGVWSTSNAMDYNLCLVTAAKVKATVDGLSFREASQRVVQEAVRQSPGSDVENRSVAFRRVGWAVLRSHPFATGREALLSAMEFALAGERRNLLRLIGRPGDERTTGSIGETARGSATIAGAFAIRSTSEIVLVVAQAAWDCGVWLAAIVGGFGLARRGRWPELLLLAGMIAYVAGASLVVANGRMRIPVTGAVAVLAAEGLRLIARAWRSARDRDIAPGGLV
ncbi:MAG: glycosyltransferase family 39 protein [Thermoanaerobaculales bacterium]